jgi:hypothetical protein
MEVIATSFVMEIDEIKSSKESDEERQHVVRIKKGQA